MFDPGGVGGMCSPESVKSFVYEEIEREYLEERRGGGNLAEDLDQGDAWAKRPRLSEVSSREILQRLV
jgi:hypothetical protein